MSIADSVKQQVVSFVRGLGGRARAAQKLRGGRGASPVGMEALEERVQMHAGHEHLNLTTDGTSSQLLPDLIPLANKPKAYMYGWQLDRAEKPGKTLLRLTSAIANVGKGTFEIRGGEVVASGQKVHQRIKNADGTFTDRVAGTFTYHPSHHHTHFDDFAQYRLRQVTANNGVGKVVKTGKKVSFCLTDSDQHDTTLPNASKTGTYYACSTRKQGISVGWADVYSQSLPDQWIDITKVKAGKYWLEVLVDPLNHVLEENENNNVTRIKVNIQAQVKPRNDDFANRTVLKGSSATSRGTNLYASKEVGEPEHESVGGSSVWFTWTAPASGTYVVTTSGSQIDTLLSVYTGTTLADLKRVAGNDDNQTDRTSRVTIQAKAGMTYQVAVDGYRGATGSYKLNIFAGK